MSGQDKPTVVVVGAGSKQGSSVVCSLLQTGAFTVKALTKNSDDPKAQDLAKRGVKLVQGDASVSEDLATCFKGAFGVFAMTFGAPLEEPLEKSVEAEFAVGTAQADAAAVAGVKVLVFSTLEDVDKRSNVRPAPALTMLLLTLALPDVTTLSMVDALTFSGKYHVPYFTAKARVQDYVTSKYPDMTSIFPSPAYFMTNFIQYYRPKREADGTLVYSLPLAPDARVPFVNPFASVGPVVAAAMLHPDMYNGQFIPVWDEQLTPTELVATFAKMTGKPAKYVQASEDAWFARPGARVALQVVWDGYKYSEELGYYAPERDMQLVRKINTKPFTWAAFLKTTGFDGSQSLEEIMNRLWCRTAAPEIEE